MLDEAQVSDDPNIVMDLRECGLLKFFCIPGMRAQFRLLDHLIRMWDPKKNNFQVGTHILIIDVEDIYFLAEISKRGSPMSLFGPHRGEMTIGNLIDEHCVIGTRSLGEKIPIKHIMDRTLRSVVFTIEKVAGSRDSH